MQAVLRAPILSDSTKLKLGTPLLLQYAPSGELRYTYEVEISTYV